MARALRIVGYAVNGSGVGHLMRLASVCRWIRRYSAHAGVRPEIYMLTSSEADGLCIEERFASFKLPSKTAVDNAGIDKLTYLALAKQWVWHSLGLLRPDLFLVDTFPRGSFGELLSALDLCKKKAFIYRPLKESFAERADFQAMLPLYDVILVPEREGAADVRVPGEARARLRYVGPIMARERAEMLPRALARESLGIRDDRLVFYISAGGGGDAGAERQIHAVCSALRSGVRPSGARSARVAERAHLVIGAGPLYRGRWLQGEGITWLAQAGGVAPLMEAFDIAICAAGYNTFSELMYAGVPSIFLPQEKIADEQHARAERAVQAGAAIVLPSPIEGSSSGGWDASDAGGAGMHFKEALLGAVEAFREPAARARASEAARALMGENCAKVAAAEALRLVLPAWEVDAATRAVTEEVLIAARELGVQADPFLDMMRALSGDNDDGIGAPDAGLVSGVSVELTRRLFKMGVPVDAAVRVASVIARRLPRASVSERAAVIGEAAELLAPFGDWSGAAAILRVVGADQKIEGASLMRELLAVVKVLRDEGEDLYRGVALAARRPTQR